MTVYKVSAVLLLFRFEENNLKCNYTCVRRQIGTGIGISSWPSAAPSYLHYKNDPHPNNNILSQHDRTSKLFLLSFRVIFSDIISNIVRVFVGLYPFSWVLGSPYFSHGTNIFLPARIDWYTNRKCLSLWFMVKYKSMLRIVNNK